jgi:hypothetical protein
MASHGRQVQLNQATMLLQKPLRQQAKNILHQARIFPGLAGKRAHNVTQHRGEHKMHPVFGEQLAYSSNGTRDTSQLIDFSLPTLVQDQR